MEEIKEIWSEIENKENKKKLNDTDDTSNDINQIQGVKVQLSDEDILVDQNLIFKYSISWIVRSTDNDLNLEMCKHRWHRN